MGLKRQRIGKICGQIQSERIGRNMVIENQEKCGYKWKLGEMWEDIHWVLGEMWL